MDNYDFDSLRSDLINYFGTATPLYPVAYMDVIRVQNASNVELLYIAQDCGFNLDDYYVPDFGM